MKQFDPPANSNISTWQLFTKFYIEHRDGNLEGFVRDTSSFHFGSSIKSKFFAQSPHAYGPTLFVDGAHHTVEIRSILGDEEGEKHAVQIIDRINSEYILFCRYIHPISVLCEKEVKDYKRIVSFYEQFQQKLQILKQEEQSIKHQQRLNSLNKTFLSSENAMKITEELEKYQIINKNTQDFYKKLQNILYENYLKPVKMSEDLTTSNSFVRGFWDMYTNYHHNHTRYEDVMQKNIDTKRYVPKKLLAVAHYKDIEYDIKYIQNLILRINMLLTSRGYE